MPSSIASLRDRVHEQLIELSRPGGLLAVDGLLDSRTMYAAGGDAWTRSRAELHRRLLDPFRNSSKEHGNTGRRAYVTSGPPGAGKSTAVDNLVDGLPAWRRIDADDFKVQLVRHAIENDAKTYAALLDLVLADGKHVMAAEISALFHRESAMLARRALRLALRNDEDVIVEGTLSWRSLAHDYAGEFARAGYEDLTVLDVTTGRQLALRRAKSRWWEGRLHSDSGGRFLAPAVIESAYDSSGQSKCSQRARELVELARGLGMKARLVAVSGSPQDVVARGYPNTDIRARWAGSRS